MTLSNISSDPEFVLEYVNGARHQIIEQEFTTAIQVQPAFDEGGNFIDVRFGPLSLGGNYHLDFMAHLLSMRATALLIVISRNSITTLTIMRVP